MRQGILAILIIALLGCGSTQPTPVPAPDVRMALAAKYPYGNVIRSGELQFDQRTTVEAVDVPALAKALPDVRFFVTHLRTGYYEYPEWEVAVAVPNDGPIAMYYSPLYGKSDPAFATLLTKARAADPLTQRAVADDIARLLALITYKGDIRGARSQGDVYSAELWHGEQYWRRISITFANGRVSSVVLTNPKDAATRPAA